MTVCNEAINMLDIDQILSSGYIRFYYIVTPCLHRFFLLHLLKSCELLLEFVLNAPYSSLYGRKLGQFSLDDVVATAVGCRGK